METNMTTKKTHNHFSVVSAEISQAKLNDLPTPTKTTEKTHLWFFDTNSAAHEFWNAHLDELGKWSYVYMESWPIAQPKPSPRY
jgi:hypothetical protein